MLRAEMCVVWSAFVVRDSSCYMYSVNCVIWLGKKKPFTKQPTSNWNYMFIPTIVLKKNIYRVISVILLLVNDKDPPPFNIHIFSPKTIVWSKFRTLYALADEYTKNLHRFWTKRINLKNLINWPLNRTFSHLIFVTFSLNGTLSHVAVMAVT